MYPNKYYINGLNDVAHSVAEWRERKGFVTGKENMLAKLMLVVTEISEAAEEVRKGNWNDFQLEMADVFIRCLDICGSLDLRIAESINWKMLQNEERSYRHDKTNKEE